MKTLLLWLEAPLQSYCYNSKFDLRDTYAYPTKSAITGLLCASLGINEGNQELLQQLQKSPMTVLSFKNNFSDQSKMRDFQIVGGGYSDSDSCFKARKIDGTKPVGDGNLITYRFALENSYFAVLLQYEDDELLEKLKNALVDPAYQIFLGRKAFIPSELIFQGIFVKAKDCADKIASLSRCKELSLFGICTDDELFYQNNISAVLQHSLVELYPQDVLLKLGRHKKYSCRKVYEFNVEKQLDELIFD